MAKRVVVFSILGSVMDRASKREGKWEKRWDKWRPTISICQHDDFVPQRLVVLHNSNEKRLLDDVVTDIQSISPETSVDCHEVNFHAPWDLENVYVVFSEFLKNYPFLLSKEDYYFHITTGSHIQQICTFLLTEAHYFPGKLFQTAPDKSRGMGASSYQIIDLDLSKYDAIASRFRQEHLQGTEFLKSGIHTNNACFNQLIAQIEKVALHSVAPMLITGPTGAGKSQLVKNIYELKKIRRQLEGAFIEINCATLRGDNAMSTLFGHKKGAFTGAVEKRDGLLKAANKGILFLDEIGELGLDEQAMLLRAVEEKRFMPVGADKEVESNFQLIAGTNKDLRDEVAEGNFREDLLARINLWVYQLPGLRERPEDIEPNLEYELSCYEKQYGVHVTFNREAKKLYLGFAVSPKAVWKGNFRDLNASVVRMATLSNGGRINVELVKQEIETLLYSWSYKNHKQNEISKKDGILAGVVNPEILKTMDLIDQYQLAKVIEVCQQARSAAEAGRVLYNQSRLKKRTVNDSHRLSVYLKKYGISFEDLRN